MPAQRHPQALSKAAAKRLINERIGISRNILQKVRRDAVLLLISTSDQSAGWKVASRGMANQKVA